jgi:VanZ family protein
MEIFKRIYLVFSWAAAIFILISSPMPPYDGGEITYGDKFVHIFLFAVLAYLIFYALSASHRSLTWQIILAAIFSLIYSAFCEYIQLFIPGRDSSLSDFVAGAIGIILALIIAYNEYDRHKT